MDSLVQDGSATVSSGFLLIPGPSPVTSLVDSFSASAARNALPEQGRQSFLAHSYSLDQGLVFPTWSINVGPPLSTNLTAGELVAFTM